MLSTPEPNDLREVVRVLREWQQEGGPIHLHPGDLGWYWRFGAEATAAAVRTWSRDGRLLAIGLLDGPDVLRLAIAPEARRDAELARRMVADVSEPTRGVLPAGSVCIEARSGEVLRELLVDAGWEDGEPWAPLSRDLSEPVEECGVRILVVDGEHAHVRAAVQRASFANSTFTDERWHLMAAGLPYADARCLVACDAHGTAVAAATVWSAGPGRPGLLEPMGVHRDHRSKGYGKAITLAAAAALRDLGSSSASVCTASSNVAAVSTYRAAGFEQRPDVRDLRRA